MYKHLKIFFASIALLLPLVGPADAVVSGTPGTPFDPHVSSRTATTVTIEWGAPLLNPDFVTRYEVRYSSDEGATWTAFSESNKTDSEAVIDTFVQGTDYIVNVASIGALGQSNWVSVSKPENTTATSVSAGSDYTCATLATGEVKCWGDSQYGQLGNGTNTESNVPVTVSGITNATSISAFFKNTCATLATGEIKCWGYNSHGQLGNGTNTHSNVPVTVSGITNATSVSTGLYHTCATLATGEIKCWGIATYGALGNGTTTPDISLPVSVSGITNAISISSGSYHTCATLATGEIKCWGTNNYGVLGNGTTSDSTVPVSVSGITNATSISSSGGFTCATLAIGEIKCWGYNSHGQLGNGTTSDSTVPVSVSGITNATSVSTAYTRACATLATGEINCWGFNSHGQLGNGTTSDSTVPGSVSGITNAITVSTGYNHSCTTLTTGGINCWGHNGNGRLGNGTYSDSAVPVAVTSCFGNFFVLAPLAAPSPISKVVSVSTKVKANKITWSGAVANGSPITKYEVRWKLSTSTKWGAWKSYKTSKSAVISGWIKKKKYNVQIKVTNAIGSAISKTFIVTQTK